MSAKHRHTMDARIADLHPTVADVVRRLVQDAELLSNTLHSAEDDRELFAEQSKEWERLTDAARRDRNDMLGAFEALAYGRMTPAEARHVLARDFGRYGNGG